jgi:hypothetical protein
MQVTSQFYADHKQRIAVDMAPFCPRRMLFRSKKASIRPYRGQENRRERDGEKSLAHSESLSFRFK